MSGARLDANAIKTKHLVTVWNRLPIHSDPRLLQAREAAPRRTDLMTSSNSPWEREVEFKEKGGEDKVEVALFFDIPPNK